jgi:uracil-DNA glycosylase
MSARTSTLKRIQHQVATCNVCTRLRTYCTRIAQEKRAAYRDETYWGRPVPGFGDPSARLLVLGLAPGAHGANRTGRMFTGDSSGMFLMRAMHAAGFANKPLSRDRADGLELQDAYILAAVRCAPPDNKPTTEEIAVCQTHLIAEWDALPHIQVVVALGRLAFDAYWRVMKERGTTMSPKPAFGHGLSYTPPTSATKPSGVTTSSNIITPSAASARAPVVIASFHPSQQNTFTGRLTPDMLEDVFQHAARIIRSS